MNGQGLANDGLHGHARIQRCKRILKNNLHVTANFTQGIRAHACDVLAIELHFTRTGLNQAKDAAPRSRFATARLSHHAQSFTCSNFKVDAINGMETIHFTPEDTAFDRKVLGQSFDF